jgi:hypothetical protein
VKGETQEESRRPDHKEINRNADHNLVSAEANDRDGVQQRERDTAGHRAEQSDPRASAIVAGHRTAEGAAEHVALEADRDQTGAFRHHATARREQVAAVAKRRSARGDENDHRLLRSMRRTSGTLAATAMMTTA